MKDAEKILVFNNLQEQYLYLNLPVDQIDENNEFTIHNIHGVLSDLPYISPVYRANFFSFVFVKDGTGQYTIDDQVFNTEPGTVYFTNPGHYKSHVWDRLNEVYLVTLSESFLKENVHPDVFEEFSFLLAETVPPKHLTKEIFAEFEELYKQIYHTYFGNSLYKNRIIGNLFVVLLLKIKAYFWENYNPIYEGNRSSQIVKNFKKTLEKHYRDLSKGLVEKAFRVQDYADEQNLHPNYLSNVIKSKTGKPIGTWIAEKTIAEAKSMLQHSDVSIKALAYQLGFAEATHFSNYFKKHTQTSPALYRKQHHQLTS